MNDNCHCLLPHTRVDYTGYTGYNELRLNSYKNKKNQTRFE